VIVLALLLSLMASTSHAVTIVHSNDVLGEIEPCGCRTNPLGGYARKAGLLKSLADHELVQLDAGDLLFPSNSLPEVLKKQSYLQAEWVLKILDQFHHDAVVPGEKDFALGIDGFLKLIHGSQVHFIAANLEHQTGRLLLEPYLILKRKKPDGKTIKIAVLGLVGSDLDWPSGLKASDPIAAARKEVPSLRKKADYVIALTHEGYDADKKLAQSVPGIDMIIGGHTQSFIQNPTRTKSPGNSAGTMIYQSSFRNQYVGLIDLGSFPAEDSYRLVGLDAAFDSPPDMPGPVDKSVTEFKLAIAKFNSLDDADQSSKSGDSKTQYQTFPRCAECHLKQFDFWRKTPHAIALAPLVKAGQDKNKECLLCHTVGLGDPHGFNNVNEMVEVRKKDDSSEFIPNDRFVDYLASLHDGKNLDSPARGISSDTKSGTDKDTALSINRSLGLIKHAWTPVQCENCHGPGGDHPMGSAVGTSKTVENTVCLSCHTQTRAPEWYLKDGTPDLEKIKAKHAQIACPAGELPSE
jgi:5'-nucleotidase